MSGCVCLRPHNHLTLCTDRVITVLRTFATSRSAVIVGVYLLMVFVSKPLRQFYQPFKIRNVLLGHNIFCCVLNLYALLFLLAGLFKVGCNTY